MPFRRGGHCYFMYPTVVHKCGYRCVAHFICCIAIQHSRRSIREKFLEKLCIPKWNEIVRKLCSADLVSR